MKLIINGKLINSPIIQILKKIREETNYYFFDDIIDKKSNILITCPFHKDGKEKHPSCNIYNCDDSNFIEYGHVHCFSCGESCSLSHLVSFCFNQEDSFGDEWLIQRFGKILDSQSSYLPPIEQEKSTYIDEQILNKFNYYHPYMFKRGISKEVIDKFNIGYNKKNDSITFPVWDERHNLIMITERSTTNKRFFIPQGVNKPIYLLDYIIKNNITNVYVTESQINALVCWTYNLPAIALFGTGSDYQYKILNKSPIRVYNLLFDGDQAGRSGADRFIKNIRKDVLVNDIVMYNGKDVADLTKESLFKLIQKYS